MGVSKDLPLSMPTNRTGKSADAIHFTFLELRMDSHSGVEIRTYANSLCYPPVLARNIGNGKVTACRVYRKRRKRGFRTSTGMLVSGRKQPVGRGIDR